MFPVPFWVIKYGGIALLAALLGGGLYIKGREDEKEVATAVLLKATEKARATEADWQTKVQTLEEEHAQEIHDIAAKRDAVIASLRNRPERLPEASLAACAGSTGRQLSRPDAEAFERLAADADELRAAYKELRAWADTVTHE